MPELSQRIATKQKRIQYWEHERDSYPLDSQLWKSAHNVSLLLRSELKDLEDEREALAQAMLRAPL